MPKLFGVDIAGEVARNIGPGVLDAVLTKQTAGTRTPGSLIDGTNPTSAVHACKGFTESYSDYNIDGTRVLVGDRKVSLLGGTLPDGVVPKPGDSITIEGSTFTIVGDVKRDPAAALYICQGRVP